MTVFRGLVSSVVSMAMVASLVVAGAVATIAGASPAFAADSNITLNSSGGNAPGKGIKINYESGKFQINRDGSGQIYSPRSPAKSTFSQISLAVLDLDGGGNTKPATSKVFSSRCSGGAVSCSAFTVNTTGSSSTGSGSFSSELTGSFDGKTYKVQLDASYIYPNDYLTQSFTVTIPDGNTKTVRLYNGYDTYLEGGDNGPGFYNANPQQVGVKKQAIEAIQHAGGPAWESYFSGSYGTALSQPFTGKPYNNQINTNPATDNGIAVNWNFGSTPGQQAKATNFFVFVTTGSPGSPTNIQTAPAPEAIDVSWTPPDGATNDTTYTATATVPGSDEGFSCTAVHPQTSCTIQGLDPNSAYQVTVTASNDNGNGLPSNPSAPVQPVSAQPPGQPGKPTAEATGKGKVKVTVTPPTTGGTPDTYTIQAYDSNNDPVDGKRAQLIMVLIRWLAQ